MTSEAAENALEAAGGTEARAYAWAVAAIVALAAVGRLVAAAGPLWLDEIWSVRLAEQAGSFWGIFSLHHDNNHYLNTLWLQRLGPGASPLAQRLPAVLAGTVAVMLMAWIGRRWGRLEGLLAALLGGGSYFMIHYGSEARGFAVAMAGALGAYAALRRHLENASWGSAIAFGGCAIVGLVGNLSFLLAYVPMAIWSAAAMFDGGQSPRIGRMAALHLPMLTALVGLWAVDLDELQRGGGDLVAPLRAAADLAHWTFGGPRSLAWLIGSIAGLMLLAEMVRGGFGTRGERWFFVLLVAAIPAGVLALGRGTVYPRYLSVCVPFALLLLARRLASCLRHDAFGAAAASVLLVLFILGNGPLITALLVEGRGGYPRALELMVGRQTQGDLVVAVDHPFRVGTVLEYHAARAGRRVIIAVGGEPARWLVRQDPEDGDGLPAAVEVNGAEYRLAGRFGHAGPSGWTWGVYERGRVGR